MQTTTEMEDPGGGTLATPTGMLKGIQLNRSKKSLNSIVDRLSKQSKPSNIESQEFMAALSLRGAFASHHEVNPEQFENFDETSDVGDEALDLSLKKQGSFLEENETYTKTDSIGALDLSLSGSRNLNMGQNTATDSPDFVLDLTQQNLCYTSSNIELNQDALAKGHMASTTGSTQQEELVKEDQDDFQANHMRVLQFLANHTKQQKITGNDVDIELLTCRYCKYASTEKSCMMAHLSTTHVSKKLTNSGRSSSSPHRMLQDETECESQYLPSSENGPRIVKKRIRGEGTHHVRISNEQSVYAPQMVKAMESYSHINPANLPASLVQLMSLSQQSAVLPKGPQSPSFEVVNSPPSRGRKRKLSKNGDFQKNQFAYFIGEEGGVYIIPQESSNSILEERLMQGHSKSSSSLLSAGVSSGTSPTEAVYTTADEAKQQQQFKLNNLCKKLAKRMGKQSNIIQGNVCDQDGKPSQSLLQTATKSRRRKSSGGKRQSLIAQTGTFSCEFCPKTFKRPLSLYGHLKQHSPLLKKQKKGFYQCKACPLTFQNFQHLLHHIKEVHSELPVVDLSTQVGIIKDETQSPSNPTNAEKSLPSHASALPAAVKTSRSRKTKPYSLREQARRDYLLDHDPMMDYKDIKFLSSLQGSFEDSLAELQKDDSLVDKAIERNDNGQKTSRQGSSTKKRGKKEKKLSKAVKILLKLKKQNGRKKVKRRKHFLLYGSGMSWKRSLRKFQSKSLLSHLKTALRYLSRDAKGHHCKMCDAVIRPFSKALMHLKKKHLKAINKGKSCSQKKQLETVSSAHSSKIAETNSSSTQVSGNFLFVKIGHQGVDHYQCNLCLQLFQGREALIEHLEMHKQIYDAGVRSQTSRSPTADKHSQKTQSPSKAAYFVDKPNADEGRHMFSNIPSSQALLETRSSSQFEVRSEAHRAAPKDAKSGKEPANTGVAEMLVKQSKSRFGSPSKSKQARKLLQTSQRHGITQSQRLVCKICLFSTFVLDEMKRHMRKHCKTLMRCDQCNYQTIEKRFIIRHIQTVHEQRRPFTCELCVYSTAYKHHLKRHYKSHSVDLLACAKCSFCTLQEGKFQEHMKEHDRSPNIVMCDDCGLTFASYKMLKEHLTETHNKHTVVESPPEHKDRAGFAANWWENIPTALDEEAIFEEHRCETCGFLAEKSDILMTHMLSDHIGMESSINVKNQPPMDTSVQCPQCGLITSKDQLESHLETHNTDETYACEHCPFETKSLNTLQKHKKKHIKYKASLMCVQCEEVQTDTLTLRNHTRKHLEAVCEDNPFRCSLCAFITESSKEGEYHLDQHNYVLEFKCQVCMYSSSTLSGLTSHCEFHRKMNVKTNVKKGPPVKTHDQNNFG